MKTTYLTLILTLTTAFSALSQVYNPIPFGETRWNYREYNMGPTTKSYNYFSKDTTGYYFQGNKFWRIDRLFFPIYSPSTYHFYIYDDTTNRKVFAIFDTTINAVKLLYDFSANAGDTIYNLYSPGNDTVKVDSVKYILDQNNINRKHLYVHSINTPMPQEWVEGVGSMYDFFIPSNTYPAPSYGFICQEFSNQFVFGDANQCSIFIMSTPEFPINEREIKVTTNAISHTINILNPSSIKYNFDLIDLNGCTILTKKTNNSYETITLDNYNNSILIYQITTKTKDRLIGKIIFE